MENISANSTAAVCSSNAHYFVDAIKCTFVLPLCVLVIHFGLQQWRQQRSGISPFDVFTYNMVALGMIWVVASTCIGIGKLLQIDPLRNFGFHIVAMCYYGECMFHILASIERYLAVVHPINYMRFGKVRGQLWRNSCIACVWLLSFLLVISISHYPAQPMRPIYVFLSISVSVNSFCGLAIISVLIRPGPGSGSTDKQRVDRKKRKALLTVLGILIVLWLWLFGFLVSYTIDYFGVVSANVSCVLFSFRYILNVPSSTSLPLIYLHNRGVSLVNGCACCKLS